jgi:superfamily II DNA or RNA helicase
MKNIKNQIQEEVIKNKDKFLILLQWATGVGKSFGAIRLIKEVLPRKVLLVVSENFHKENWIKEFEKFNNLFKFDALKECDITIECYASLKKYENTSWDLLVLDECHHLSELRISYLQKLNTKKVCALSATLEETEEYSLLFNVFKKTNKENIYVSKIGVKEAIEMGLIPKPYIYIIPLTLDNTNKNITLVEERGKGKKVNITCDMSNYWTYKLNSVKYPNLKLTIKCTQKETLNYYDSLINFYKNLYYKNNLIHIKNKWLKLGLERKKFLGGLKTNDLSTLLEKVKDKRLICFCSSIEQANTLGKDNVIHSKNKQSKSILSKFQKGDINSIFCVGMLVEGQNLNNIEVGIISQLDGKIRPFIQKHGRVLRSNEPIQFIFYYKNTQDEIYLNNVLESIDKRYIHEIKNLNTFKL